MNKNMFYEEPEAFKRSFSTQNSLPKKLMENLMLKINSSFLYSNTTFKEENPYILPHYDLSKIDSPKGT